ncbi:MAG: hypothetical protein EA401_08450 [Planctomycetota bacterium]|nr:MAG: hypothetical protein EA401_08450 [Planctomycetota bacterium]
MKRTHNPRMNDIHPKADSGALASQIKAVATGPGLSLVQVLGGGSVDQDIVVIGDGGLTGPALLAGRLGVNSGLSGFGTHFQLWSMPINSRPIHLIMHPSAEMAERTEFALLLKKLPYLGGVVLDQEGLLEHWRHWQLPPLGERISRLRSLIAPAIALVQLGSWCPDTTIAEGLRIWQYVAFHTVEEFLVELGCPVSALCKGTPVQQIPQWPQVPLCLRESWQLAQEPKPESQRIVQGLLSLDSALAGALK